MGKKNSLIITFLLFTFLSLLLFWPIFAGKVNLNGNLLVSFYAPYGENLPFKNTGWDALRIYFPFLRVTLDSIKNLEIPLWNPYAFSGHSHMADFQTAVFYPLNIFGLFLSQIEFWHLLRITPTILAAFFTFLYLRNLRFYRQPMADSRMTTLAAIFGALTFGFSPFILTWGEEVVMSPHSIVWLPLILWAIDKYLELHSRSGVKAKPGLHSGSVFLAIIAIATAFSLFGGYMQTTIYMFIFAAGYLTFRFWTHSRSVGSLHSGSVGMVIGAFVLGMGLAAVQLLPSAELFFNAARADITLRDQLFKFLLPIESLFTYLAPDFFGHPATANFFRRGDAQYYEGILFVGVATLIFAIYMILKEWNKWLVKFLAFSGLLALFSTIDWFGAKLFLSLPIPFLSTSIPNRILFIPAFCLAVLAAGGFDRWLKEKLEIRNNSDERTKVAKSEILKPIMVIAGMYGGILVTLALVKIFGVEYFEHKQFLSEANWLVSVRNLVIPLVVFLTTTLLILLADLRSKFKNWAAVAIIVLAFLHIFYFSQKYFSFSDRERIFPENEFLNFIKKEQGYFRSWGVGEAFLENNFASQYGIFWPEGYDSLNNRSYGEFTYAMQGANIGDFVFRADAGLGRGVTAELIENPDRRRLIDMVGVRYVIGKSDEERTMVKYNFKKVFEETDGSKYTPGVYRGATQLTPGVISSGKGYAVYENLAVMPRAFLASNYEGPPHLAGSLQGSGQAGQAPEDVEKQRRRLIPQKLLSDDFDFRNVLILEKPSPISPQFGEGNAQIVSYKSQEVLIKTKSDQPKLLFLSDNFYPGWKATVDGDEVEILRADYTFRAVPLTHGGHEVRFYYDSDIYKMGLVISIAGVMILGFLSLGKLKFLR